MIATARPVLRPYQVGVVERLRQAFRGHQRLLAVLPTGAGKTVIAGEIVSQATTLGKRVCFLAHRAELIEQTSAKLDAFGVPHGVIMAGHARVDPAALVQVASVQTLARRLKKQAAKEESETWAGFVPTWARPYDLIVVDECHHACAGSYVEILKAYPKARILGLTATPYRLDGKGLGEHFDDLVVGARVSQLIAEGYLVRTRTFAPPAGAALAQVKTRGGDFDSGAAGNVLNATGPIGEIVSTWKAHASDRVTVGFACTVAHAESLAAAFRAAGIPSGAIDGTTEATVRAEHLAMLRDGRLQVLWNCALLTEGWDLPSVGCVILARPTKSRALVRQMWGRGMRSAPGKSDCIILDHADNARRFGSPDDDDAYSLQNEVRETNGHKGLFCESCDALIPKGAKQCPECGAPLPSGGDGSEFDGEREPVSRWVEREAVALVPWAPPTEEERRAFYLDRVEVGRRKGYLPGWAANEYKRQFGHWPLRQWATREAVQA